MDGKRRSEDGKLLLLLFIVDGKSAGWRMNEP
jgi:hypothetical protein